MNDTFEPTVERLRQTFQAVADQVVDVPPVFDAVPVAAAPLDDASAEVKVVGVVEPVGTAALVVDLESARLVRAGRRRRLIAVAAAVAALLVAGTVLGAEDRHIRSDGPASRTPKTTPLPPPGKQFFTPSGDAVFPLKGAMPSTPETGELVAAVAFTRFINLPDAGQWRDTSIELYADGRLLRFPTPDVHGGIAEQRLSPEGVELVRSAFAPTGLLDPAQTPTDIVSACSCVIKVRDDSGRLTQTETPSALQQVDPLVQGEVDRLIEFITHLDASLPASAWADREIKAYVPSRYGVDVWIEGPTNGAVPDLSNVLTRVLPTPLVQHLDDQGWQHTPWGDSVVLTTADARALAQALIKAGLRPIWPGFNTRGMGLTYGPAVRAPDRTYIVFRIRVEALLPDGSPLWAPG